MTGPEIVQFSNAVTEAYDFTELSRLLLSLNQKLSSHVTANVPFPKQVQELIAVANSEGWIVQLVMAIIQDRSNNQAIKDFLVNNPDWDPASNPPLEDPCDTLRIFGGKSFIGRNALRAFLKKMNTATGRKVLLITSEQRKVGKTYSKDLIDFLSVNRPPSGVVYLDLDSDDYDPGKLAKKLGDRMERDITKIPEENTEQAARSNQELVNLLIPIVPNPSSKVWWIILDGFRQKIPSEATQDFIAQLAQQIQGTLGFRLILLNYTYRLPLAVEGFVFRDKVQPVGREELEVFLSGVHKRKYKADPSSAQLSQYLTGVDDLLNQYTQSYPESANDQLLLNMAVTEVADAI